MAAVAPLIPYIITAVGAGAAAYGSYATGKAQQYEFQAQAEQAKLSARDQEIQRRQRLLKALASRQVATAAGGTTLEGSPLALINEDYRQAEIDSQTLEGMSSQRLASLKASGRSAKQLGSINAGSALLQGASSLYKMGPPKKGP